MSDRSFWITWYDLPADGRDAHLAGKVITNGG